MRTFDIDKTYDPSIEDYTVEIRGINGEAMLTYTREQVEAIYAEDDALHGHECNTFTDLDSYAITCFSKGLTDEEIRQRYSHKVGPLSMAYLLDQVHAYIEVGGFYLSTGDEAILHGKGVVKMRNPNHTPWED